MITTSEKIGTAVTRPAFIRGRFSPDSVVDLLDPEVYDDYMDVMSAENGRRTNQAIREMLDRYPGRTYGRKQEREIRSNLDDSDTICQQLLDNANPDLRRIAVAAVGLAEAFGSAPYLGFTR